MGWVSGAVSAVGMLMGNKASKAQAGAAGAAAQTSAEASAYATRMQKEMFDKQMELQKPWQEAGVTALNKLTPLATNYQNFGMDQFQQDPGYAFRLSQGQKTLDQQAAARGGLISGNALRAAQKFGQEMGSQEYQNAFNRYQTERNAQLAPLQSLAGMGQSSAQNLGSAAGAYGTNVGNIALGNAGVQGNALLTQGGARASQYSNLGSGIGGILGMFAK